LTGDKEVVRPDAESQKKLEHLPIHMRHGQNAQEVASPREVRRDVMEQKVEIAP
jgi:hypothetical protein